MQFIKSLARPDDLKSRLVLVLISITLYSLSMPGSALPLLTWVTFVPIALAISSAPPKSAALIFYLAAIGCNLVVIWWLIPAVVNFTQLNQYLAFLVLIGFTLMLASPYALIGWLVAYKQWFNKPYGMLFISVCFVVVVTLFPTPLPANYAHSLYQHPIFLQLLAIGGVPMVFFIVVFVNLQFVRFILAFKTDRKIALYALVRGLGLLVLVSLYGAWQLAQYEGTDTSKSLKVGIVQPKLIRGDSLNRLYRMTEELVAENPDIDLLVWPEFPTAFSYVANKQDKKKVDALIKKLQKPMVIVSGYSYDEGESQDTPSSQYYNTAHLIDQKRQLKASYRKQTLVPFFEYLPNEQNFPFLRKLFPDTHRYASGSQTSLFQLDDEVGIIPLICYETIFPGMTQDFIEQGGNLIINLTNDIWLGDSKGSAYHFSLGLFRSIEHRVPWVRATNSGISGVASAAGIINQDSLTPVQSLATRVFEVAIPAERSFYSRFGDWFLYSLIVLLVLALFDRQLKSLTSRVPLPSRPVA